MLAPSRLAPALLLLMLSATAASAADCTLIITPLTDRGSYQLGEPVQVQLQVSSTGDEPCTQSLQHQEVVIEVLDSNDRPIAHSRQGFTPSPDSGRLLELEPGESANLVSIPWAQGPGSFPSPEATAEQIRPVNPGTYRLRATWIGGGVPARGIESYPFEISKRPFQAHVPVLSSFGVSLLASLLALGMWVVMRPVTCENPT